MNKITKVQAGIAGEYLVAAELTKLGYVVTLASKNTENFDALVSREDASKAIGIQIKTNQYNQPKWIMSYKNEKLHNNNLFYVFVILGEHTEFYIVPSETVSTEIRRIMKDGWIHLEKMAINITRQLCELLKIRIRNTLADGI